MRLDSGSAAGGAPDAGEVDPFAVRRRARARSILVHTSTDDPSRAAQWFQTKFDVQTRQELVYDCDDADAMPALLCGSSRRERVASEVDGGLLAASRRMLD